MKLSRRGWLLGAGAALLAGCEAQVRPLQGGWVGAREDRGHRLRDAAALEQALRAARQVPPRRTEVLIVGGGVSGLACARALAAAGRDFALLELEDETGGNARSHAMGGMACPLGAHYLPLPGERAPEVIRLLEELGLSRVEMGRRVYDERHLCHSPQERLFFRGRWIEGLLPPALDAKTREDYLRFGQRVGEAQRELGFAIPTHQAPWTAAHAQLDAQTFSQWLNTQQLDDPQLRWYLDYCCRDDYGAGADEVSAWAGLHYFASRHGFHAGDADSETEREAVLTWPEGNAWLTRRIALPLKERLHCGRTVLRVTEQRHGVELLAWNEVTQQGERWQAEQLVMATPLFIAARLVESAPEALRAAARQLRYAPWLVANLQLDAPLLHRVGAPPSWDNVVYGSEQLGYVDAGHQRLSPVPGPTVLSAYWALPRARRGALYQAPWQAWAEQVLAPLRGLHPDLPQRLLRVDLMRWGHAMSIPVPGLRGSPALAALRQAQGRLHFAHSDLAGYSIFEEAYTEGLRAATQLLRV